MSDSTNELLRQIKLGEDSILECKTVSIIGAKVSAPSRHDMADELAAMANAFGGTVLLGVEDKTKTIVGIPENHLDCVEEWIRAICNDSIVPQLFCCIRKISLVNASGENKPIIRIDVPKSLFVHHSPGGYYQRLGSSKRQMSPEVLARLFQQRSQSRLIRFDESVVETASADCLKTELWKRFKTPLSPSDDMDFLLKMKLLAMNDQQEIHPTISGILLCTEHPEEYLPNAFIQAVAYRGTERNAMFQMDAEDIVGPLDTQIIRACKFVQRNMRILAYKNPGRVDVPQYSLAAIFEAVVNAVAHRDYSIHGSKIRLQMFDDRLDLFSPGSIPNTMTIESMPLRQYSRNELITSLLSRCAIPKEHNYSGRATMMDKRGEGIPIIFTESEKLSRKKPVYRLIDDELLLTIYPVLKALPPDSTAHDGTTHDGTGQVTEQVAEQVTIHDTTGHVAGHVAGQVTEQVAGQVTIHDGAIHDGAIHDGAIHDSAIHDSAIHDTTGQVTGQVTKLIQALGDECLTRNELMSRLGLKNRDNFIKGYLQPALILKLIEMTIPDKPQSHNQRYRKKTMDKTKPMDNQP